MHLEKFKWMSEKVQVFRKKRNFGRKAIIETSLFTENFAVKLLYFSAKTLKSEFCDSCNWQFSCKKKSEW